MKIFMNGLELGREATGEMEVGQVLSEIQSEIHAGGKVLLGASIDGVAIESGFRRRRQLATPVTRVAKLELLIQDPEVVSEQILKDSLQIYRQIQQEAPVLATRFRMGDEFTANQQLADVLDRLTLSLKGSSMALKQRPLNSNLQGRLNQAGGELMPVLDRVLAAQTSGDYTALADQLEYKLPTALKNCYDCMLQATETQAVAPR